MDMNEVIEFANQNSVAWLATVEDGIPHVRGLWMWFADESGFYFHTASIKRLAKQLAKNNAVEAAFHRSEGNFGDSKMLRVNGRVDFVKDAALEKRLYEERPWLLTNKAAMPETEVLIFRIAHGECEFWDMRANGREKDQTTVRF